MQAIISILVIVAVVLTFMLIWSRAKASAAKADSNSPLLTLTDENFGELTKNGMVLVDFWADWCSPCRMMTPILHELASELPERAFVGKVNVEQYRSLSIRYKVQSIPTMILFKNGREIKRFIGVKPKEFLMQQFQKLR